MTTSTDNRSSSDVVGILFDHDKLHGCRVAKTLLGSVRYQRASVDLVGGDLATALAELFSRLDVGKQTLPIAAAIPTEECYFATRPIASSGTKASPRTLLRESLRSNSARLDQMAIDVIHWQPDRRTVAGICAAPNERVESIRSAVAATKHSLQRLEPAAAALIGVAPEREGRERRYSLTTRVLLGESHLLAVMSRGAKPIHWQRCPLPPGDEATGIVSAIRSLETAAGPCGLDRTPDAVVIHGRHELQALLDQQWLTESLEGTFRWVDGPTLDGGDVAQALAERLLAAEDEGFDLVRQHRDPLQLRHVVPYKEIIAYLVAACLLAGVLWTRLNSVRAQHTALVSTAPPIVGDGMNPKPELERLNAATTAVSRFLDKRVHWGNVIAEITGAIPPGTRLTDIRGSAPMSANRKGSNKTAPTTLILRAECALTDEGAMPQSLETLAEKIHSLETVNPHFENVELSDLRRMRSRESGADGAEFSIVLTGKTKRGR